MVSHFGQTWHLSRDMQICSSLLIKTWLVPWIFSTLQRGKFRALHLHSLVDKTPIVVNRFFLVIACSCLNAQGPCSGILLFLCWFYSKPSVVIFMTFSLKVLLWDYVLGFAYMNVQGPWIGNLLRFGSYILSLFILSSLVLHVISFKFH